MYLATLAFPLFLFMVLFFAAFAFLVKNVKHRIRDTRSKDLEARAQQMGLSYSADDTAGLLAQLKSFHLFRRMRGRLFKRGKITNAMQIIEGETEIWCFDYSYKVSTGNSTRTISQTVFFANDKNWYLPNFILKPETFWHKILQMFGVKDINIDDNQAFSDQFWLKGKDELDGLIRQKFSPDVQELLLRRPPAHLEGNNYYLLEYSPGKLIQGQDLKARLNSFINLVQRFKTDGKMELLDLAELQEQKVIQKELSK